MPVAELPRTGEPHALPHEESEELDANERAQMDAMSRGEDPVGADAPDETAGVEDDQPGFKPDPELESISAEPDAKGEKPVPVTTKGKREARVPLPELQKERERRQSLEKQLAEAKEAQVRSDERWRMLEEAKRQAEQPVAQQQPEPEPDRELDPIGWQDWKIRRQDEWLQYLYQQQQQSQQYNQQTQYQNYIQSSEVQFAQQNPEYFPAINKLQGHLDAMFTPAYPDPQQRRSVIAQWTQQTIQAAVQSGRNPAAVVYEVAKNAGLTEQEAQVAAAETEQVQRATQPNPSMAARNSAQRSSRTLSNVTGSTPKMPVTSRDIADMTEEQWEHYREQFKGDPLEALGLRGR